MPLNSEIAIDFQQQQSHNDNVIDIKWDDIQCIYRLMYKTVAHMINAV